MQPRAFNQISIDLEKGTLTKYSINTKKLQNEIYYYLDLPKEIASFFPSLIDYNENYSDYKLEYIPYHSISELILKNKISKVEGGEIISNLLKILQEIHSCSPNNIVSKNELYNFYIKKTKERINDLERNSSFFRTLLSHRLINVNGQVYKSFSVLEKDFCSLIKKHLKTHNKVRVIHGDFSFSNILYSPLEKIIKLVDPRGSFVDPGIFGHVLYDYSKLMHCLHGRYDYIVNDQYHFEEDEYNFKIKVFSSELMDYLERIYTHILIDNEFNMEFVYLIESSLFLSMASLHYENHQRQKMFYLTGLILLNQIIEGKYENMH